MGGGTRGKVAGMKAQWAARVIGILMLIGFIALMVHLQHQLEDMRAQRPAPTSTP